MSPSPDRVTSLAERFLVGLHAGVPAALLAVSLLQLFPPSELSSPARRPLWAVWGLVGLWLAFTLLLALPARRFVLWRGALSLTSVWLLLAALAGMVLHSALAMPFALALGLLALACVALAPVLGPHRVREHHRHAAGNKLAPRRRVAPPPWRRLLAGWPFWVAGVLMLQAFWFAHIVAREPQRGSGMVGMLVAFFLLLPAATLAPWLRRTAATLAACAAAVHAWLALHSELALWWAAAALSLTVVAHVLMRWPAREERRR